MTQGKINVIDIPYKFHYNNEAKGTTLKLKSE